VVLANSAVSENDIGMHLMNPTVPLVMPMLPPRGAAPLSADALDRLVGDYALTPTLRLTITREGNALYGQATGQGRFPLTATAPDRFVFRPAGSELTFDISGTGQARQLTLRQGGGTITAVRHP
jgi:hypothetical protein